MLPALVAHADWSSSPSRQRLAVAALADGGYVLEPIRPVPDSRRLLPGLRRRAGSGGVLAGFDFPIGVPRAWAEAVGVESFRELLPELGTGEWRAFFEPAGTPGEIGPRRPFYPRRPGGTSQAHLVAALGVGSMDDLLRRCDRRTASRRAACSIFWTLGANQVGRAAIGGWRDLLQPALGGLALWPFDGPLAELVAAHELVVAETYPAEAAAQLALEGAKSDAAARAANAGRIRAEAARLGVELEPPLVAELERGFDSDDGFDALVGLLGMLAVVLGDRPSGEPRDDPGLAVEGWILGQAAGAAPAPRARPRRGSRSVVVTAAERPDLWERAHDLDADVWPEYNRHGDVLNRYWGRLDQDFADFQFVLYDEGRDELLAQGHTIPFRWDGTADGLPAGIDGLIEAGFAEAGPNTLAALAVEIPPEQQSRGLSVPMLEAMASVAARHGFGALVAPVRPSWKERYPLVPIERYAAWARADGLPLDPWLRVHARMGAETLGTEPRSLLISGDVASWERWTGLAFPESGDYVFPHGLATVRIDVDADAGVYWEPNVWVRHRVVAPHP